MTLYNVSPYLAISKPKLALLIGLVLKVYPFTQNIYDDIMGDPYILKFYLHVHTLFPFGAHKAVNNGQPIQFKLMCYRQSLKVIIQQPTVFYYFIVAYIYYTFVILASGA